jgi:transcriptional regulator with XRE-family HTH domain
MGPISVAKARSTLLDFFGHVEAGQVEGQKLESDPTVELVRILRRRREELGWPQSAVDAKLGVTDCLTAKWETFRRRPSPHMLWLWCVTLGCELVVKHGPPPPAPARHRHAVERRVKRGEREVDPHARPCNAPLRPDAPANPYEP